MACVVRRIFHRNFLQLSEQCRLRLQVLSYTRLQVQVTEECTQNRMLTWIYHQAEEDTTGCPRCYCAVRKNENEASGNMIYMFELHLIEIDTWSLQKDILTCTSYVLLAEVGRLETPKQQGKYETGQLFLQRVFGYRGVVLFPWLARVYDRDVPNKKERQAEEASGFNHVGREVKGRTHTYYQVLIDSRDCPFIRAQTEAVTFLGNQESSRSLYAIPGLDYVAHEDVLPYTTTEKQPLNHELFDKFLMFDPDKDPPFSSRETLRAWQEKNHPWLELSDVHKETTENIRITVIPFYMGCREAPNATVFWWRYCIRLENLGELSVQLRERHWRIFSLSGTLETVRGRGVIGQEPVLSKVQPAFQYSSHVSLQAPSGHMWGTFQMEREDGYVFDCRIPPFSLESKHDDNSNNPQFIV